MAEEEGQQQGADVGAVHIGVGHDDDAVVADLLRIHVGFAGLESADGGVKRGDFLRRQRLGAVGFFHIEYLPAQGQNRLKRPRAPLLGRAAGGVALHQKQLAFLRILLLTIRQLAGQSGGIKNILAPRHLARATGRVARLRRLQNLPANRLGLARVFIQINLQRLRHHLLHNRTHLRRHQLFLGLRGKLGVRHANGQDARQALAHVLPGNVRLYLLGHPVFIHVRLHHAGDGGAQSRQVRAAVALRDVVRVTNDILLITVVPLHRGLNLNVLAAVGAMKHLLVHGGSRLVQEFHIGADAAVKGENLLAVGGAGGALVIQGDG